MKKIVRNILGSSFLLSGLMAMFIMLIIGVSSVYCQTVTVTQEFVNDSAKAFALVVEQRDAIENLKKENADLRKLLESVEKSQRTPCVIAMDKTKVDLTYWLGQLETSDTVKKKEVQKILKNVRKDSRKLLMSQCGFQSESDLWTWIGRAAPFVSILLLLR